jgi:hypothetical protein
MKKIIAFTIPILVCIYATICLSACTKKATLDNEIAIKRTNIILQSQEKLDIDKMVLLSNTATDFDLSFISGLSFGSNSEFTFGAATTDRKLITTNSSLFDNITQLEQLKTTINNTTSTPWPNNTYNLEPNYNSIPSKFIAFKTNNGKLCLMRINQYSLASYEVSVTLLIEL